MRISVVPSSLRVAPKGEGEGDSGYLKAASGVLEFAHRGEVIFVPGDELLDGLLWAPIRLLAVLSCLGRHRNYAIVWTGKTGTSLICRTEKNATRLALSFSHDERELCFSVREMRLAAHALIDQLSSFLTDSQDLSQIVKDRVNAHYRAARAQGVHTLVDVAPSDFQLRVRFGDDTSPSFLPHGLAVDALLGFVDIVSVGDAAPLTEPEPNVYALIPLARELCHASALLKADGPQAVVCDGSSWRGSLLITRRGDRCSLRFANSRRVFCTSVDACIRGLDLAYDAIKSAVVERDSQARYHYDFARYFPR